ncbi:MAG TPA: hypothetical protein VGA92_00560 [Candidatus Nitrosotenuis sp.]|jgi:hypothetical protein
MGNSSGSYVRGVAAIHKKYQTALKHARSRQSVLNAYWRHKKESERLLAKHLRDEMAEVKRIKGKMEYR